METRTPLSASLTRYLNSLIGRNLSEHTVVAYRTDPLQFFTWLSENDVSVTSPKKITRAHILEYLSHLAGLGRSGVTRTRKLAAIREYSSFWSPSSCFPAPPLNTLSDPNRSESNGSSCGRMNTCAS